MRIASGIGTFEGGFETSFYAFSVSRKGHLTPLSRAGEVTMVGDKPTMVTVDFDSCPTVVIRSNGRGRDIDRAVGISEEAAKRLLRAGCPCDSQGFHDYLREHTRW